MSPTERLSRYEIRVQGALDARWSSGFDGLKVRHRAPDETTLTGPIRDQSELHGVLANVRDLGRPSIAVRCLDG